jgi:hypothetical protein
MPAGRLVVTGRIGAAAVPAMAQNQDGRINVAVGHVTILEAVNVGVAA